MQLEKRSQHQLVQVTRDKVDLAKSEQRVADMKGQVQRCQNDQQDRMRELSENRSQLVAADRRARQATRTILSANSSLAELYLEAEFQERETQQVRHRLDQVNHKRSARGEHLASLRQQWQQLEQRRHQKELEANAAQLEREGLA